MVMGPLAERSQSVKVGEFYKASGFLAKRNLKSTQLVMHINTLDKV
jgi:primosomal replication protein N